MSKFEDLEEGDTGFPLGATATRPAQQKKPNGEAPADPPVPFGESAFHLVERDLPEPVRLCDPWCTAGLNIVAGRPKLGKTTLERQKLAAAATGANFLDSKFANPTLCMFLCLEEGEHLARLKFKNAGFSESALAGIQLFFQWERGLTGVDMLNRYLDLNPDVQFIVIDSLTRFRVIPDSRTNAFLADYEAISQLHEVTKQRPGLCIDVVHHTRKAKGEDPMDDISGTYGLTAACDSYLVLRHHSDGATLFVGGRLWTRDDNQYLLKRMTEGGVGWDMIGAHIDLPAEQIETLNLIKASPTGLGPTELGDKLNITKPSAWQRIDVLIEKGFVVKRFGKAYLKGSIT